MMKMNATTQNITCPHCGKKDTWQSDNKSRPFCSERCKLIDLGGWASEKYRAPSQEDFSEHLLES